MEGKSHMRWVELVAGGAAVALAAFAVSVDIHNDEVQAAVLVIAVGGFLLGALVPRHAWRWALILGLSIFAGEVVGFQLGLIPMPNAQGGNATTLVALIPAFIATYLGVGVRRAVAG